jgi:hypothetical protein
MKRMIQGVCVSLTLKAIVLAGLVVFAAVVVPRHDTMSHLPLAEVRLELLPRPS